MEPRFFPTAAAFRAWLEANHATERELWMGVHKVGTGKPSITWPEAVDQALCFGWIDGVRRRFDDTSYVNRFTPRRTGSRWSAVNVRRFQALRRQGLVHPAGLRAFEAGAGKRQAPYSYERGRSAALAPGLAKAFRAEAKARAWFQAQAPWYRRACTHWVMEGKQEATRRRRLATLVACSARGAYVPPLAAGGKRPARKPTAGRAAARRR